MAATATAISTALHRTARQSRAHSALTTVSAAHGSPPHALPEPEEHSDTPQRQQAQNRVRTVTVKGRLVLLHHRLVAVVWRRRRYSREPPAALHLYMRASASRTPAHSPIPTQSKHRETKSHPCVPGTHAVSPSQQAPAR